MGSPTRWLRVAIATLVASSHGLLHPLGVRSPHIVTIPRCRAWQGAVARIPPCMAEREGELALSRWIESEGGYIADCVAVAWQSGRRGLYVTDDVKVGTELARVPKSCLIFAEEHDLQ